MGMLYTLFLFFKEERDHHGTYFCAKECVLNATYRRLSCRSDEELLVLRDAARYFAQLCEETRLEREEEELV